MNGPRRAGSPGHANVTGHIARDAARHPAAWRFLLPRKVPGPVVLASLEPVTTQNLLRSYPSALVLARSASDLARPASDLRGLAGAAIWDGHRSPLRPGSIALVVCDDRDGVCAAALAPAVADGGGLAAIVRSSRPYRFALFPTPEQLRAVIGAWWPLTYDGSPRHWVGYVLAGTPLWRCLGRSGLAVSWPCDSLVDVVLDQVGAALGSPAELRGLIAGRGLGQVTLRVRCAGSELAVRVAASPAGARRLENHQRVLADLSARLSPGSIGPGRVGPGRVGPGRVGPGRVGPGRVGPGRVGPGRVGPGRVGPGRVGPGRSALAFPEAVASGSADGISWAAERWLRNTALRAGPAWRPSGRGWVALRATAAELAAAAASGRAGAGWARCWVTGLDAVAPALLEEIVAALAPIEAERMATAWFHGDLWPGNVILRRSPRPPVVIDWERARADAPAGLDAVYAEVCRIIRARRCTFGQAAAWLAGSASPELAATVVGGRPFAQWGRPQQQALLLATVTHYATGENEGSPADPWTESWGELNVLPIVTALRALR